MGFEIPKINMFQQPVAQIGAVGARGPQAAGGSHKTAGGQTPYNVDMADFERFLPAFNGTGELRPNNAEPGARLQMLYA